MKLSQVAKPSTGLILSPTLRIRIRYAALMMLGIAIMLFAVAGSVSKDQAAAVGGWGVGFLLLSVLLLGVIGIAAVWGQLVGVAARDVKNELADRGRRSDRDQPADAEQQCWSEDGGYRFSPTPHDFFRRAAPTLKSEQLIGAGFPTPRQYRPRRCPLS